MESNVTTVYVGPHFEKNLTANTTTSYYYAGSARVAMRQGSMVYYLHADHLGSTSLATDVNGAVVPNSATRYYPYGSTRSGGSGLPTPYRFTAQYSAESSLGLYFYNARWYDPALGRFVSADTLVPSPQNPQSLNRYAYVLNNPLKYTDPTGHCIWDACILEVALLAGGLALIADWGVQVHNNMAQGQSFWEATSYENVNEVETVGAGVGGAGGAALAMVALPAVPAAISAAGLTGSTATAATIGLGAAVNAGATVAGDFTGRVAENSLIALGAGESPRTDLWDASTYTGDIIWGGAAGGTATLVDIYATSAARAANAEAQAAFKQTYTQQAMGKLWDASQAAGHYPPPGQSGFRLWTNAWLGPSVAEMQTVSSPLAQTFLAGSRAFSIGSTVLPGSTLLSPSPHRQKGR